MKLSILSVVVASVGLVAANPMRVVIVNGVDGTHVNSDGVAELIRPLPAAENGAVAAHPHLMPLPIVQGGMLVVPSAHLHGTTEAKKPGCGAGLRHKAAKMVNSIKVTFGFGIVKNGNTPGGDALHILHVSGGPEPHRHHAQHQHRPHHLEHKHAMPGMKHQAPPFLMRVHYALMSLGPWEGRAVAFVLGCGIGVLLRMAWVLVVLATRAFRSSSQPAEDYYYAGVEIEDAEEIFVAPPMYTVPVVIAVDAQGYPVEKVEEEERK